MPNGQFYSYEQASQRVEAFEKLLNKYSIKIQNGSELERVCLNVIDMLDRHIHPELPNPMEEFRKYYAEILGLNDLIIKLLRVENHPCFVNLVPHFELLNASNAPQNVPSIVTDSGSNKLFELLIGAICMSFSDNVSLDNPINSKGDIPDIAFTFCGRNWGIECKVIHSFSIKSVHDRIIDGVEQIENSAKIEKGFVTINLKNIIDHDKMWPITNKEEFLRGEEPLFRSFRDLSEPTMMLYEYGNNICMDLVKEYGTDYNVNIYKGKKSLPGFLQFIQTATSITIGVSPFPTTLGIFNWVKSSVENLTECERQCLQLLNCSMHYN